jgi:hypothetical protein
MPSPSLLPSLEKHQLKENEERIRIHANTIIRPIVVQTQINSMGRKEIIQSNFFHENEWRISQKIILFCSCSSFSLSQRFNIIIERNPIKMGNLYSKWVLIEEHEEEEDDRNANKNQSQTTFQLVTYSLPEESISHSQTQKISFFPHPHPHPYRKKQMVNELYFIYQYVKSSIQLLNQNNIIYFQYDCPINTILLKHPQKNTPVLSNFGKSFSCIDIQKEELFHIIERIEDFTNYPIEVYILYYLKNTQRETLSYCNLEEILETREKKERKKDECKLKKWINKSSMEIYNLSLSTVSKWDQYGLKMMFRHTVLESFISYDDDDDDSF